MVGGGKVVERLGQRGDGCAAAVCGTEECAVAERCRSVHAAKVYGTSGHLYAGSVGFGIVDLMAAVGAGHVGEVAPAVG